MWSWMQSMCVCNNIHNNSNTSYINSGQLIIVRGLFAATDRWLWRRLSSIFSDDKWCVLYNIIYHAICRYIIAIYICLCIHLHRCSEGTNWASTTGAYIQQGIYTYTVGISNDSEIELLGESSPVFHIQTETGDHYYQWMVDIIIIDLTAVYMENYLVDLSAYLGQRINVSYALATVIGITEYSQNTVVQVPAGILYSMLNPLIL